MSPSSKKSEPTKRPTSSKSRTGKAKDALTYFVTVAQQLSMARDLSTLQSIVRKAARELTGADGATFVLRKGDQCYYADEDAISPLWKGSRFPLRACISGWAMLNRQPAIIEDIYSDDRIPIDAYKPTFVKSLVMVPIRRLDPIGAIGNYWAQRHLATPEEVSLIQALADTTAVALENIQVYSELEQRVKDRTSQLTDANTNLLKEINERKLAERQNELQMRILECLTKTGDQRELIRTILLLIKNFSGCEAVGIRLRHGLDYPYYVANGFVDGHVEEENRLCAIDEKGEIVKDSQGNPILECMCGNIICGRFDTSKPFFTQGGSFWTNCTTDLLASTTEEDRQARTRNRCNGEGYESVALIPLRSANGNIGLLQLNDHQRGCFTLELIRFYEGITQSIVVVLEHKQVEDALHRERDFSSAVVDNTGALVVVLDREGRIVRFNEACEQTTGYTSAEVFGKVLWDFLIPPEDLPGVRGTWQRLTKGDFPNKQENYWLGKDGSNRFIAWSNTVLLNSQGEIANIIASGLDITERKQSEQLKDEFIGLVSHELRTPMTVITGSLQTAMSEGISLEDKETLLQNACEGVGSLSAILENLLELSRYRAGRLQVRRETVNIPDIAKSVIEKLKTPSESHRFQVDFPHDLPPVEADPVRVDRILYNLLENATKYSPEKSVIKVFAREKNGQVITGIADKGIGISPEDRTRLFELFERLEKSPRTQGLGLGLVVCKRLVEAQGGSVWVESEPEKGSTFYFTLPMNRKTA